METKTKRFDWRSQRILSFLERVAVAVLILLFFYTAISKLADLSEFRRQLYNQVIPAWSVEALVFALPGAELCLSLMLILEMTRKLALVGVVLLMSVFTIYMGLVLLRVFPRVPCSCGGVLTSMDFTGHFIFNLVFLMSSVFALRQQKKSR